MTWLGLDVLIIKGQDIYGVNVSKMTGIKSNELE